MSMGILFYLSEDYASVCQRITCSSVYPSCIPWSSDVSGHTIYTSELVRGINAAFKRIRAHLSVVPFQKVPRGSLPPFLPNPNLPRHLLQPSQHLPISLHKPIHHVRNPYVCTKLPYIFLRPSQIVSRHPREQMMHSLKLQSSM